MLERTSFWKILGQNDSDHRSGGLEYGIASRKNGQLQDDMSYSATNVRNLSILDELAHVYNNSKDFSVLDRAREMLNNPIWLVSIVISLVGITANGLTVRAIMYTPKHDRSAHLKFIISLACSDILILVALFCGDVIYIWSPDHTDCIKLFKTLLLDVPLLATLLNLLAMAVDHYLMSFRPLHHHLLMSRSHANYVICAIWVFSTSMVILELLIGLSATTSTLDSFCVAATFDPYNIEQLINALIFVVLFVIILTYIRIYMHVRMTVPGRQSNKRRNVSPSMLTMTLMFIGTFVIFWTPAGIFSIYIYIKAKTDQLNEHRETYILVNNLLFIVLQLNSLADPVIYAIGLPKVQQGCRIMFCNKVGRSGSIERCFIKLKQTHFTSHSTVFRQTTTNFDTSK